MAKGPDNYVEVKDRIVEFREKFPSGSLQTVRVEVINVPETWMPAKQVWESGQKVTQPGHMRPSCSYVLYQAAAYRTPDDPRPGHGVAWEPIPGRTNFTEDSEAMNAETSAWGRAMVAALAVDAQKGIASQNEVRARQYNDAPSGEVPARNRSGGAERAPKGPEGTVASESTPWNSVTPEPPQGFTLAEVQAFAANTPVEVGSPDALRAKVAEVGAHVQRGAITPHMGNALVKVINDRGREIVEALTDVETLPPKNEPADG